MISKIYKAYNRGKIYACINKAYNRGKIYACINKAYNRGKIYACINKAYNRGKIYACINNIVMKSYCSFACSFSLQSCPSDTRCGPIN